MGSFEYKEIEQLERLEEGLSQWFDEKVNVLIELAENEGRKVLDIGCGIGSISKRFRDAGFTVTGIDPSQKCLDIARRICGVTFVKADVADFKKIRPLGKFDIAIASEVLEHLEDPVSALKNINALLKQGGVLIITVPAFSRLYSSYDRRAGHVKRYSIDAVRKEVSSAGFTIERIFYWNTVGLVGWFLICKLLGRAPGEATNRLINMGYGALLKIEKVIKPPLGLTIVVKGRKKGA